MTRHRLLPLIALGFTVALGAAACHVGGSGNNQVDTGVTTTTTATGTATPTGTGAPTTSTGPVVEFSTDGAGPYQLGKTLTELKPQLQEVGPDNLCTGNTTARGTGVWQDIRLEFHADGKLFLLTNKSIDIPTPSGAWIGQTSLTDLKTIYKGLTTQDVTHGTTKAFLVQTLGGSGILFELDPNDKVATMYAASDAFYLKNTFAGGTPFC